MRVKDPVKAKQIRTKALEMVLKRGLDGFSMQKLARSARVSPATLYIHFQDKDDLIFQLFKEQHEALTSVVLDGFDPMMPLAVGLRIQWQNRIRFCRQNPAGWSFLEQIAHSPYIKDFSPRVETTFFDAMRAFVHHAVSCGELTIFGPSADQLNEFSPELLWALAFAPLYQLMHNERGQGGGPHRKSGYSRFDDQVIDLAFECVLRSLQPQQIRP